MVSSVRNGNGTVVRKQEWNPRKELMSKISDSRENKSKWAIYSFSSPKIRKIMTKHLTMFQGYVAKAYFGEMLLRSIQTCESEASNTVAEEDHFGLDGVEINPVQAVQVRNVQALFKFGRKNQQRIRIICKDIPFGGNSNHMRTITAENDLAEILSVILKPKDMIFIFGDVSVADERGLFLNMASEKVRLIALVREEPAEPFDTNSKEYEILRRVFRRMGTVVSDFHLTDCLERVWRISPIENPFQLYRSMTREPLSSGLSDESMDDNKSGIVERLIPPEVERVESEMNEEGPGSEQATSSTGKNRNMPASMPKHSRTIPSNAGFCPREYLREKLFPSLKNKIIQESERVESEMNEDGPGSEQAPSSTGKNGNMSVSTPQNSCTNQSSSNLYSSEEIEEKLLICKNEIIQESDEDTD